MVMYYIYAHVCYLQKFKFNLKKYNLLFLYRKTTFYGYMTIQITTTQILKKKKFRPYLEK